MKKCSKCGEIKELSEYHIDRQKRGGHRPDCRTCHIKRGKLKHAAITSRFSALKGGARKRDYPVEIDKYDYAYIIATQFCKYCGDLPWSLINGASGIDRVNNSLGYVLGNVVACCGICNMAKGTFASDVEFEAHILKIAKNRGLVA